MNVEKWINKNGESLKGKTVVITGANGGLGSQLCRLFARFEAKVVMPVLEEEGAKKLIEEIKAEYPNFDASVVSLNLASIENVDKCIEQLKTLGGIDILIHNAGVYNVPLKKLDSGYNMVFQINFLYPYYMTKKLMAELEKKPGSKVVAIGSVAHKNSKIDEKDIDFSTYKQISKTYGNSKRFLMFAWHELFKNNDKVSLSIVHPGVTLTNISNHYPKAISWLVMFVLKIAFPKPKQAILSIFKGCYTPCKYNHWIGPSIFDVWGKPKQSKLKDCKEEERKKIFDYAENMYATIEKNKQ